ncbi:hypothetical protein [Pilimelia columellifera]|uniref:Uncharacterized protein n=1 Tax=Pilimelia columellifera subsp. columellifera TaxID=706583 RepID=A0ABP6B0J7_9ACTN
MSGKRTSIVFVAALLGILVGPAARAGARPDAGSGLITIIHTFAADKPALVDEVGQRGIKALLWYDYRVDITSAGLDLRAYHLRARELHPTPIELLTVTTVGQCRASGEHGVKAGVWIEFECVTRPDGQALRVR